MLAQYAQTTGRGKWPQRNCLVLASAHAAGAAIMMQRAAQEVIGDDFSVMGDTLVMEDPGWNSAAFANCAIIDSALLRSALFFVIIYGI